MREYAESSISGIGSSTTGWHMQRTDMTSVMNLAECHISRVVTGWVLGMKIQMLQIVAVIERFLADTGYACRNRERGQSCAVIKRPTANGCNACQRKGHACYLVCSLECIIADCGYVVGRSIVGNCFGNGDSSGVLTGCGSYHLHGVGGSDAVVQSTDTEIRRHGTNTHQHQGNK